MPPTRRPWLDHALALDNLLTAFGILAMLHLFVPDLFGRWAPAPLYSFLIGAGLIMAGAYVRNKARDRKPPP